MHRSAMPQYSQSSETETDGKVSWPLSERLLIEGRLEYLKTLAAIILTELGTLEQPENIGRQLTLKDEVSRLETELIRNVLTFTRGSQRRAARVLGLNATTLHTKIRRLRIDLKAETADD